MLPAPPDPPLSLAIQPPLRIDQKTMQQLREERDWWQYQLEQLRDPRAAEFRNAVLAEMDRRILNGQGT